MPREIDVEAYRPAIEAAMDAAREVMREHGHGEIVRGALFFELENGNCAAGSHPKGDYLGSARLAGQGSQVFMVNALLDGWQPE